MLLTPKGIRSDHKYATSAHTETRTQLCGPYFVILSSVETPSTFYNLSNSRRYDSVIRRMKILVCVSIDSLWVFVLSVLNWDGKDGKVRVGLIILYKFSAKCRLLLCRSFQMISTLNSNNYTYIKPMIEACR